MLLVQQETQITLILPEGIRTTEKKIKVNRPYLTFVIVDIRHKNNFKDSKMK